MPDNSVDAATLKNNIQRELIAKVEYWSARKDDHPYERDPDYFYECKDNMNGFSSAKRITEQVPCTESIEKFKSDLLQALENDNTPYIVSSFIKMALQ